VIITKCFILTTKMKHYINEKTINRHERRLTVSENAESKEVQKGMFLFKSDDSVNSADYPLGTTTAEEAEKAIAGKGSGHLYYKYPGDDHYSFFKRISE